MAFLSNPSGVSTVLEFAVRRQSINRYLARATTIRFDTVRAAEVGGQASILLRHLGDSCHSS